MGWFSTDEQIKIDEYELKIREYEETIGDLKRDNEKLERDLKDIKYPILESLSYIQHHSLWGGSGSVPSKYYKISTPHNCERIIDDVKAYKNIFKTLYENNIINEATWKSIVSGNDVFDYIIDFVRSTKMEMEMKARDESDTREDA